MLNRSEGLGLYLHCYLAVEKILVRTAGLSGKIVEGYVELIRAA
jgi:hypothetical protein